MSTHLLDSTYVVRPGMLDSNTTMESYLMEKRHAAVVYEDAKLSILYFLVM